MSGKKKKESKAEKLIRKGAGVPFKRPWQKRKPFNCKQVTSFLGILKYGQNHIKPGFLYRVKRHIRCCDRCRVIGGALFKFR